VETYTRDDLCLEKKVERIDQRALIADLVALQYKRTQADFCPAALFRVRGRNVIDIFFRRITKTAPGPRQSVRRRGGRPSRSSIRSPATSRTKLEFIKIYANSHYVTPRPTLIQAIKAIKSELKWRLDQLP